MVLDGTYELFIAVDANALVSLRVLLGDFQGPVGAAVVVDDIFPVFVRLSQDTFNALGNVPFAVVDRCQDTYQRLCFPLHDEARMCVGVRCQ